MQPVARKAFIVLSVLLCLCAVAAAETVVLDNSIPTISGAWGYKGLTFTIAGKDYHGTGFPQPPYRNGYACFSIEGYDRFQAVAGIQDITQCQATLVVAVDGEEVFRKQMRNGDAVVPLDIPLTGHKVLRLERIMRGDGADFLEPRLVRDEIAPLPDAPAAGYPLISIATPDQVTASVLGQGKWLSGLPDYGPYSDGTVHAAIDLRSTENARIYPVMSGTVDANTGMHGGFGPGWSTGGVVVIRSTGANRMPYWVIYGHTQQPNLSVGGNAVAGAAIGQIGPWNASDGGPHLHLSVRLRPLPRVGWGTPTLADRTGKPGCEHVATPQDVVNLGYRDPMTLFNGQLAAELQVGCDVPEPVRDALLKRYALGYYPDLEANNLGPVPEATNHIGRPADDQYLKAARATRLGNGYVQTFRRHDNQNTALLVRDGASEAYWVHGAIWATYASSGGLTRLGYPLGEETAVDEGRAQRFTNCTIIYDAATGLTRIQR